MTRRLPLVLSLLALFAPVALAQTGKIAGRVTDNRGEILPGVNVVVDGTARGAVSDADGYYTILAVPPGTVRLRATLLGYAPAIVENVIVSVGQTTTLNIRLREEDVEGQEVLVTAERPVVELDVASSRANISAEEIERLPVTSVVGAVALQAGVEGGTSVRGSASNELQFNVNGLTIRDERTGTAYTAVPISSVQAVQLVTGGFNAEYGNVRSGVINVETKEGNRHRYEVDALMRFSPPGAKNFDQQPNDRDSYWIRPFIDPQVAFVGTRNGGWDLYTQQSYPEFIGWLAVSERLLADADPTNDLTPEALYQAFLWQHRKTFEITKPDYTADIGIGGPVPGLSRFGGTRFYTAYRRDQSMYLIPLSRDRFTQETFTGRVTTNVTRGLRVSLESLYGNVTGTASSRAGDPGVFGATSMADDLSGVSFIDARLFTSDYWNPVRTRDFMLGARVQHALTNTSFYELRLARYASFYDTGLGRLRDTTKVVFFGGVGFDEGPFGFQPNPSNGVDGMRMGVGLSNSRDTSRTAAYNLKFDYTNQFHRAVEVKTGIEYNLTDSEINYGSYDAYLPSGNFNTRWDRSPTRLAAYGQTKLEYRGIIANLGVRLDQSHAGGTWYAYNAFSPIFANAARLDTARQEPTKKLLSISPRLGVSFPITRASKLFVNYGHFRSMPNPNDLYQVRFFAQSQQVTRIADPNAPLPKTIAYELGFEQSLLDRFLFRATGYYKNVFYESRTVTYNGIQGGISYSRSEPNGYADIRGFEVTVEKRRGRVVNGFVNYTYMVRTAGRFGLPTESENPTTQKQNLDSDGLRRAAESRPVPQPFARGGLNILTPATFGPSLAGVRPLGGWLISAVGSWRAGAYTTWAGGGTPPEGVLNNLQFKDFTNLDLRFARDVRVGSRRVQLFADVLNVFNQRRLSFSGFVDGNDQRRYFTSLHLPEAKKGEYITIPGTDRPGDFRRPGVAYQPMFPIADRATFTTADPAAIYYERKTNAYIVFQNGQWAPADQARVQAALDSKAYIDMPNQGFLSFLSPRDVFFGLRINL
jgi:hypothetical protein